MKTKKTILTATLALATLVSGTALFANAASEKENDALIAGKVKISLIQAVGIAQKTLPGTPAGAIIEIEDGTVVWDIDLINPQHQVVEIVIDANTGKVLKQEVDDQDND